MDTEYILIWKQSLQFTMSELSMLKTLELWDKAVSLTERGLYEDALMKFMSLEQLTADPNQTLITSARNLFNIGQTYFSLGRIDMAIKVSYFAIIYTQLSFSWHNSRSTVVPIVWFILVLVIKTELNNIIHFTRKLCNHCVNHRISALQISWESKLGLMQQFIDSQFYYT